MSHEYIQTLLLLAQSRQLMCCPFTACSRRSFCWTAVLRRDTSCLSSAAGTAMTIIFLGSTVTQDTHCLYFHAEQPRSAVQQRIKMGYWDTYCLSLIVCCCWVKHKQNCNGHIMLGNLYLGRTFEQGNVLKQRKLTWNTKQRHMFLNMRSCSEQCDKGAVHVNSKRAGAS